MTNTDSPLGRPQRSRRFPEGGHRRGRSFGAAVALAVAGLLVIGAAPSFAAQTPQCTTNVQQGKLCVTEMTDTPDPVSYSSFDDNKTFLTYHTVLKNSSRSSQLSHVGLTEALPPGTTLVRATTTRGTCSGSVSCTIGSLRKGETATVDVVITAPATSDPNPGDQVITNLVTANFDERFSDQPNNGGKVDTVTWQEGTPLSPGVKTTVSKSAGQTYVPAGKEGQVSTDPAQSQYANTTVTNTSQYDLLAKIKVLSADNFCLFGQVTIQGQVYVCRGGGWNEELVTYATGPDTGNLYSNPQQPVVKHLRWSAALSSGLQTQANFVVFDRATATSPVQVIGANGVRCNAPPSAPPTNMPCITNVVHEPDGGWSVDYVRPDDRRMR